MLNKTKVWIPFITGTALATVLVFCSNKKSGSGDSLLVKISNILKQEHYAPPKIDDEFSKKVFSNVLEKLDNDKRFFTASEVARLKKYETSIDDQIKAGRYDFFDSAWNILMGRLDQLETHCSTTLDKPFDYKGKETYTVKEVVKDYQPNINSVKSEWSKWLKYQSIDRLYRKLEAQKNRTIDSTTGLSADKPYDTLELKARTETLKFCSSWFKRWRKMDRRDQIAFYVNCITEIYDPHTNYYPPEDKANFDISMTGKLEGIGATLSERDGYIRVESIVPGSASYKQGELKVGDLIIKVAQGSGEPVDVVDMKIDDAIQLIRGKKGSEVRLTVKKPDGVIKVISIIRETVVIEESYARSGIVEIDGRKFGVINLPSFYADFNEKGRGRHSSEDVEIEVKKLKAEGVQGIILDLRNNGGGSLADAIDMGGLFINQGPIVQVRDPDGRVRQGGDPNPGITYDGPLVVLTNTYSASASEILAAALQDYKRAVIVGSKSTFGKGTVQTFLPIGGGKSTEFPNGFGQIKVTVQKFYRINGGTTQLRGVIPDVILPDLYDQIEQGEKEMRFHMQYDKIKKSDYNEFKGAFSSGFDNAVNQSKKRVAQHDYYATVKKRAIELKKMRDQFTFSLNLEEYTKQQQKLKEENKKYTDSSYSSFVGGVKPLKVDLDPVAGNDAKTAQKKEWLKIYDKDAALDESVRILMDLI